MFQQCCKHGRNFNPRPREEGDELVDIRLEFCNYFNPRPREEGDFIKDDPVCAFLDISIHALVKRATF